MALEVIRHHRLLESYLSEALGMPWDRVHEEAEVLEHYISEDLEALIAEKLGEPSFDPHGDPIPGPDLAPLGDSGSRPLSELEPGGSATFARVSDTDPAMLRYLSERGITPGVEIVVTGRQPFDGPLLVEVGGVEHALGAELVRRIRVGEARSVKPPPVAEAPPPLEEPPAPEQALEDVLPGEAAVAEAARRSLDGHSRGLRRIWPFLGPAFIAAVAYIDPGNFATNIAGGRQVRLSAALGDPRRQPDRDGRPDPVGEARNRLRKEPRRGMSREIQPPHIVRALDPG